MGKGMQICDFIAGRNNLLRAAIKKAEPEISIPVSLAGRNHLLYGPQEEGSKNGREFD